MQNVFCFFIISASLTQLHRIPPTLRLVFVLFSQEQDVFAGLLILNWIVNIITVKQSWIFLSVVSCNLPERTHKYTQAWTESAWRNVKSENKNTGKKEHKTTNTSTRKSTSGCWHTDTMSSPSSCLCRGGSHTHKTVCAKSLQSKSPVNHLSHYPAY